MPIFAFAKRTGAVLKTVTCLVLTSSESCLRLSVRMWGAEALLRQANAIAPLGEIAR